MYRSMYDLLNKSIDYSNEYKKLWDMIFTERYYIYNKIKYTFTGIFDKFIVLWKYKGTKCSCKEVIEELKLEEYPNWAPEEAVLRLCDFIINIHEFLMFEKNRIDIEANEAEKINRYYSDDEIIKKVPYRLYIKDKMIMDLIQELLYSLNYEYIIREEYKCFIIKKNVDAEETAKIVEDDNVSNKILEYNDIYQFYIY